MSRANDYPFNMTYQEIADELGISRERVRQIERAALEKLRNRWIMRQYYLDYFSSNSESRDQDSFLSF